MITSMSGNRVHRVLETSLSRGEQRVRWEKITKNTQNGRGKKIPSVAIDRFLPTNRKKKRKQKEKITIFLFNRRNILFVLLFCFSRAINHFCAKKKVITKIASSIDTIFYSPKICAVKETFPIFPPLSISRGA